LVQNFIFLIFQFFSVGGERKTHWIPAKREKVVIDNVSITKTIDFCVKWFLLFKVFSRSFRSKWVQNGFSGEKKKWIMFNQTTQLGWKREPKLTRSGPSAHDLLFLFLSHVIYSNFFCEKNRQVKMGWNLGI